MGLLVSIRRFALTVIQLPCTSVSWESDPGAVSQLVLHPCIASPCPHLSFREKFQSNSVIRFLWRLDKRTLWLKKSYFQQWCKMIRPCSIQKPLTTLVVLREMYTSPVTRTVCSYLYLSVHQTSSGKKEGLVDKFGQTGHNRVSSLLNATQQTCQRSMSLSCAGLMPQSLNHPALLTFCYLIHIGSIYNLWKVTCFYSSLTNTEKLKCLPYELRNGGCYIKGNGYWF